MSRLARPALVRAKVARHCALLCLQLQIMVRPVGLRQKLIAGIGAKIAGKLGPKCKARTRRDNRRLRHGALMSAAGIRSIVEAYSINAVVFASCSHFSGVVSS